MSTQEHWRDVWSQTDGRDRSWFQVDANHSLALVARFADPDARIVDVGGGSSRLVDHLLDRGHPEPIVVDVAKQALDHSRHRLGSRADEVRWVEADVRVLDLGADVDVWHDRAVLHFLVESDDQRRYVDALERHVAAGGHAILATFAIGGPEQCSGLPVQQYDAASLATLLGDGWSLVHDEEEHHTTPGGATQRFTWAVFGRTAAGTD